MKKKLICGLIFVGGFIGAADAFDYQYSDKLKFNLSGYGMVGGMDVLNYDRQTDFIYDWQIAGRAEYDINSDWKVGAIIGGKELNKGTNNYFSDVSGFVQAPWFRAEVGLTSSIAKKLWLGVPDVGALRINQESMVYKNLLPDGMSTMTTTAPVTASTAVRGILVSPPKNFQVGVSFAPGEVNEYRSGSEKNTFDYVADLGIKYRHNYGATKYVWSAGVTYINNPIEVASDDYSLNVTADSRTEYNAGVNVQWKSYVLGFSGKIVYDLNPIGLNTDGLVLGAGLSYDILNWSFSGSYFYTDTSLFDGSIQDPILNTALVSIRYKYDKYWDLWMSVGDVFGAGMMYDNAAFVSGGLRFRF